MIATRSHVQAMPGGTEPTWPRPPRRPRLGEGEVHLWRADLTAVRDHLTELLCSEEYARAARFHHERKGQLWKRGRGLLRVLLGGYLRMDPMSLSFSVGAHGKPVLVASAPGSSWRVQSVPLTPSKLSFNLAHSGALALYAFTYERAVGVDIEVARRASEGCEVCADVGGWQAISEPARRPINEVALAARAFGREKACHLEGLQPANREREFLRAWVRHEAALKCQGIGIGMRDSGTSHDEARTSAENLWVAELDVGPRAAGAVVLERAPLVLRCWEWPPQDRGRMRSHSLSRRATTARVPPAGRLSPSPMRTCSKASICSKSQLTGGGGTRSLISIS